MRSIFRKSGQYGAQKYTADSWPFASHGRKFDVRHSFPVLMMRSTGGIPFPAVDMLFHHAGHRSCPGSTLTPSTSVKISRAASTISFLPPYARAMLRLNPVLSFVASSAASTASLQVGRKERPVADHLDADPVSFHPLVAQDRRNFSLNRAKRWSTSSLFREKFSVENV